MHACKWIKHNVFNTIYRIYCAQDRKNIFPSGSNKAEIVEKLRNIKKKIQREQIRQNINAQNGVISYCHQLIIMDGPPGISCTSNGDFLFHFSYYCAGIIEQKFYLHKASEDVTLPTTMFKLLSPYPFLYIRGRYADDYKIQLYCFDRHINVNIET